MQCDAKKTKSHLKSSDKNMESNQRTVNPRSFAEYILCLILAPKVSVLNKACNFYTYKQWDRYVQPYISHTLIIEISPPPVLCNRQSSSMSLFLWTNKNNFMLPRNYINANPRSHSVERDSSISLNGGNSRTQTIPTQRLQLTSNSHTQKNYKLKNRDTVSPINNFNILSSNDNI